MAKKDENPHIHNIAYRFALDRKQTSDVFDYIYKTFGCRRKVYNIYVDLLYKQLEADSYVSGPIKFKAPETSALKKTYPYLKEVHALALSNAKLDFEDALKYYKSKQGWLAYKKAAKLKNQTIGRPLI